MLRWYLRIFRSDPMQSLSLGIPNMLNECMSLYLSDQSWTSTSMQYLSEQLKAYQVIRRALLRTLAWFSKDMETNRIRSRVRIALLKQKSGGRVAGLFTETNVIGMLEAKDYEHLKFCFFSFPWNLWCLLWKHKECSGTICLHAVHLPHCTIKTQNFWSGWTRIDLAQLQKNVQGFYVSSQGRFQFISGIRYGFFKVACTWARCRRSTANWRCCVTWC